MRFYIPTGPLHNHNPFNMLIFKTESGWLRFCFRHIFYEVALPGRDNKPSFHQYSWRFPPRNRPWNWRARRTLDRELTRVCSNIRSIPFILAYVQFAVEMILKWSNELCLSSAKVLTTAAAVKQLLVSSVPACKVKATIGRDRPVRQLLHRVYTFSFKWGAPNVKINRLCAIILIFTPDLV